MSLDFIERHWKRWHLPTLSANETVGMLLNMDFIDRHLDEWDCSWNLSGNAGLGRIISLEFIDKYIDYWDWDQLSCNIFDHQEVTADLIDKYIDYWDYYSLCSQATQGLHVLLHPRYQHLLDVSILSNKSLILSQVELLWNNFDSHDRDEMLMKRTDLTPAFIAAHPEVKWKQITSSCQWTWTDLLDFPHLPWDHEELLLQECQRDVAK